MTTARTAVPPRPDVPDRPLAGPRHRRPLARRRRVVEELAVLLVVLVALGATVFLLASQWLQNSTMAGAIGTAAPAIEVPLSSAFAPSTYGPSTPVNNPATAG